MNIPLPAVQPSLPAAPSTELEQLRRRWPVPAETAEELKTRIWTLLDEQLDDLPSPGSGRTTLRWHVLAEVAALDLALVKLFEAHVDARAILDELGAREVGRGELWAVWAADPPIARVFIDDRDTLPVAGEPVVVSGRKAWCSGAGTVTHALVTCGHEQGKFLVAVDLSQPAVTVTSEGWFPIGMEATTSVDVLFDAAVGIVVGGVDSYLTRPGFWQGGAGIAACWWGAACRIGECLLEYSRDRGDPHAQAHLGAVDSALSAGAALLRDGAGEIDARPESDALMLSLRTRAAIEDVCEKVLRHSGRALGAAPFCRNRLFSRMVTDLPVFVRQSHAERDLARLGVARAAEGRSRPWRVLRS